MPILGQLKVALPTFPLFRILSSVNRILQEKKALEIFFSQQLIYNPIMLSPTFYTPN